MNLIHSIISPLIKTRVSSNWTRNVTSRSFWSIGTMGSSRASLPSSRPTIFSLLPTLIRTPPTSLQNTFQSQIRHMSKFGSEYQPSTLKRKRRWGFLARLKNKMGQKILKRRILKGRKHLSH